MLPIDQTVTWLSLLFAMTILANRLHVLDTFGAMVALPIGFTVLWLGTISWFFILLLFFLLASILTKYKYKYKEKMGYSEGNRGARGWKSVLANGGPSALFAVLYHFSNNNPVFVLAFVGSISFALSDTVATEVGLLGQAKPRSIITGKKIDTGQSGGVTLQGEIAALICSLFIASICGLLLSQDVPLSASIIFSSGVIAGMISTNIDSIFGATIQAKYLCAKCKKCLETKIDHCQVRTELTSGIVIIDNNIVNLLGALIGAAIAGSVVLLT